MTVFVGSCLGLESRAQAEALSHRNLEDSPGRVPLDRCLVCFTDMGLPMRLRRTLLLPGDSAVLLRLDVHGDLPHEGQQFAAHRRDRLLARLATAYQTTVARM